MGCRDRHLVELGRLLVREGRSLLISQCGQGIGIPLLEPIVEWTTVLVVAPLVDDTAVLLGSLLGRLLAVRFGIFLGSSLIYNRGK